MPILHLQTLILAPIEVVFDLALSIDFHLESMAASKERAVAGRTQGQIELGESVTWEARHFGIVQQMEVKITALERPVFFMDEMVRGAFRSFQHTHRFEAVEGGTLMMDEIRFESPAGIVGSLFNALVLSRYLRKLIDSRNQALKRVAEAK